MNTYFLLNTLSFLYIILPSLIFVFGWLKPQFALPIGAILLISCYRWISSDLIQGQREVDECLSKRRSVILKSIIIIAIVIFVVFSLGIGGYTIQCVDYSKHNAFFKDLMQNPWPIAYEKIGTDEGPFFLNVYMGYYLPASLVGKLFGWSVGYHFSFVWAVLGVSLSAFWFLRLIGIFSPLYVLLFLFFGGMDIVGTLILFGKLVVKFHPFLGLDYWMPLFSWSSGSQILNEVFFISASNTTFLFNCPHHILPAWVCIFLIMNEATKRRSSERLILIFACLPVCSAFVALGTTPFVIISLFITKIKKFFSFENCCAATALLIVMFFYFSANNGDFIRGWLWEFQNLGQSWPYLLLHYMVEFGFYLLWLLFFKNTSNHIGNVWWIVAVSCFIVFPFYRIGVYCDLASKGIIAPLVVFQVCLASKLVLAKRLKAKWRHGLLMILLVAGSLSSIESVARGIHFGINFSPPKLKDVAHINELEPQKEVKQLFSDGNSFFWRVLAKPTVFPNSNYK